jgi:hypothetical protein
MNDQLVWSRAAMAAQMSWDFDIDVWSQAFAGLVMGYLLFGPFRGI